MNIKVSNLLNYEKVHYSNFFYSYYTGVKYPDNVYNLM